jgi:hypothetical protein
MKDTTIKDQQETIERLQKELKEKSEMIFKLTELIDKKDKIINNLQNVITVSNIEATKQIKQHLALFNDPYFKGLTIEQIIELAKKSIRLTDDNCKMRHKLEDIADLYDDSEYAKEIKKIICRED